MTPRKEVELQLRSTRRQTVMTVSVVVIVLGLLSAVMIRILGDSVIEGAYYLGALLGVANGVVGFLTIELFIDKSTLLFLKGVFLGMGARLVLLLGAFIFLYKVVNVNVVGLVSGLLVFYFTMTVLEVIFLNRRIEIGKELKVSKQ